MKNTFINNYRRNTRRNTAFDKTNVDLVMYKNVDTFNITPDSAYAEMEIKKVIDRLDDDSKIPFMMHVEGYKYEEIAQKLNIKLGTVKSRIFLTRKKLMDALKDYN
jgi:RNA polymerase sigma-70 factor (ECF subfamily)